MRWNGIERRRNERGSVLVFVTIALVALLAFAAWSTETGQAWTAKGQLQAASDSAALAGAGELLDPNAGQPSDPAAAVAAAQTFGAQNHSIGVPITIPAGDIQTGSWNMETRTFTPMPGSNDPEQVRAVRVLGRRDDTANGPVPTVLGKIFGVDDIPIAATATAYIGFAGLMPPGTALLPIAIDCCKISGASCDQDYCSYVASNPPNPQALVDDPDLSGKMVTALEFASSNGLQNACWTELDPVDSSINTPGLEDIIDIGWDHIAVAPDGRTLTVYFWGGAEDCYGLAGVTVDVSGAVPTITIQTGTRPGVEVCVAIAQMYSTEVVLDAPVIGGGVQ